MYLRGILVLVPVLVQHTCGFAVGTLTLTGRAVDGPQVSQRLEARVLGQHTRFRRDLSSNSGFSPLVARAFEPGVAGHHPSSIATTTSHETSSHQTPSSSSAPVHANQIVAHASPTGNNVPAPRDHLWIHEIRPDPFNEESPFYHRRIYSTTSIPQVKEIIRNSGSGSDKRVSVSRLRKGDDSLLVPAAMDPIKGGSSKFNDGHQDGPLLSSETRADLHVKALKNGIESPQPTSIRSRSGQEPNHGA